LIANHLGPFECNTQVLSLNGSGDDLVDASRSTYRASSSDPQPFMLLEGCVSVELLVLASLATSIAVATPCEGAPAGLAEDWIAGRRCAAGDRFVPLEQGKR
jgi:hypothetical protein